MKKLYSCCSAFDVHRSLVKVNLKREGVKGLKDLNEVRKFGTMTRDLLSIGDWLREAGCTHIAVESTGVFWKPVFNILGDEFKIVLVNARHYRAVPGHKTDARDCQWLCELLQHGLLKPSFIPPQPIRKLRDLTRNRRCLIQDKASSINRIHKILQDANIKLSSVITDIMGKSGLEMIDHLIRGDSEPAQIAECARGKMKSKKEELVYALEGKVTPHHRFLLFQYMEDIRFKEEQIEKFNQKIDKHVNSDAFDSELITLLSTIPGVDKQAAEEVLAEIGTDMEQFPTEARLSSWAGICPGNNQTGGKRKSGKTTKGSNWLRSTLSQVAWAASHTKDTYLSGYYKRLVRRRGKKRAIIALGHKMLIIMYHMIKNRCTYKELGPHHFDKVDKDKLKRNMIKRLEKLGYNVTLSEKEEGKVA